MELEHLTTVELVEPLLTFGLYPSVIYTSPLFDYDKQTGLVIGLPFSTILTLPEQF